MESVDGRRISLLSETIRGTRATVRARVRAAVRATLAAVIGLAMMVTGGCGIGGNSGSGDGSGDSAGSGSSAAVSGVSVELPNYYMPGMVLQRGKPIHIRGTLEKSGTGANGSGTNGSGTGAQSGNDAERVQLTVRFVHGDQKIESSKQVAIGTTFDITVKNVPTRKDTYTLAFLIGGQVARTVRDVYVGDVFVAAGQSNMELNHVDYYGTQSAINVNIAGAFAESDLPETVNDEGIHFITAAHKLGGSSLPLRSVTAHKWASATGSNSDYLGYLPQLFAARLRKAHPNVPVGIIQIAWGGTAIALHMKGGDIYANHVKPFAGYRVAGVLWYQGENDAATQATALRYESDFAALINQYRSVFGEEDLPFLYVQLARYSGGNQYTPIVRQAQFDVLDSAALGTTSNLAMTVSLDTDKGTSKVIHPLGKDILAERMATQWFAMTGDGTSGSSGAGGDSTEGGIASSGPIAQSAKAVGGDASTVSVSFAANTAIGLRAMRPDYTLKATATEPATVTATPLQGFEVAGSDGAFHAADATVQGNQVIVHSDDVDAVTQVRYLWGLAPNSASMLYDSAKLPASPFVVSVG